MSFPDATGWMKARLDDGTGVDAAYVLGWRITDEPSDKWTRRFNSFKAKEKAATFAAATVLGAAVPELIAALGWSPAGTTFLCALSSGETAVNPSRYLPVIVARCAAKVGAQEACDALAKSAHKPIHDLGSAAARSEGLDAANYTSRRLQTDHVFLFDDFITRGSTMSHIASAIRVHNPEAVIVGVALAKTERLSWNSGISNDHMDKHWDAAWTRGEEKGK